MSEASISPTVFLTLVRSPRERACARLLIGSLRSFGGELSRCPVWLFDTDSPQASATALAGPEIEVLPLNVPDSVKRFFFADKVWACARAEAMAASAVQSLIWIDPSCLVIQPPLSFDLGESFDAAVRPVHIQNVGLPAAAPLDDFWSRIVHNAGVADIPGTVETFVDRQRIRSYFNSHAFAINPSKGLLQQWFERFESLVCDEQFRQALDGDQVHQIFLHQAVWTVLLATNLEPARLHILTPNYNYPYNLHESVPLDRRATSLNDVVCIAYEDRPLDPDRVEDIDIREPLRSWLLEHARTKTGHPER